MKHEQQPSNHELQGYCDALQQRIQDLEQQIEELMPYKVVVEQMPAGASFYSPDGTMMMANTHLQHTLNTSAEEIVGRYNIFQAPEEINKVSAKHFQRALQGEQTTTPPTSYHLDRAGFPTSPNHLPLWLQSSFIPIYGQNSSLQSVGVVCIDLTGQITSEQELQKSERRFQTLIEHNADAMIVIQDDHIRFSNPAAAALFGCGVNDLHGYPFGYPVTIDSKIEVDIYNRHGRHIIAEMCVVETEWEQQPAYLATLRDITEHKRVQQELIDTHRELERRVAERTTELHLANAVLKQKIDEAEQITSALRDSEDRYRTIVTNVPVVIFTTNEDGILTLSEGKGLEELGLKPGQLVGQSIFDIYHDIPDGLDAVRRALQGEFVIWEGQVMGRTYESRLTPIFNETGKVIRIIGLAIDVTERKAAEQAIYEAKQDLEKRVEERTAKLRILNEELSQAIRAKDDFLANMSHELRTPLNAILGLSEAIQEGIYGEVTEGQAKTLRTIETSGQHLLSLINDILDLSKIEAGKMELDYTTVNVKRICRESLEFVTHQANQKRIDVTFEIDVSVTTIEADELRLKQILINLLTNAVKFTPEGGFIGLEVSDSEEVISFIIWDTGIGIETAMLPNLFRPFVQLDSGLNRRHGGTGLGLALVARLSELHGGSVAVESQPAQGSRFTVFISKCIAPQDIERHEGRPSLKKPELPTVDLQKPAATNRPTTTTSTTTSTTNSTTTSTNDTHSPTSAHTILLAEDSETTISIISDYLMSKGFHIIVAMDGQQAVEYAIRYQPDVILMDVQMPVMDGLAAIEQLRDHPRTAHTPIIALTALAMVGDRERCLNAGADDYLSKPVRLKELTKIIQSMIGS